MRDPTSVGADLTPAQQDETLDDLAFFLDTFGSTRAVRAKLQEQESDIKRLDRQVRYLLAHPRDKTLQQEGEEREEREEEKEEQDGADETMADVDFFLRTFGSTRAVREKLEAQSQKVVGLRRTVQWLQERWHPTGEKVHDDSSDVEYVGTEPAKAGIPMNGKSQVESDEDTNGTDNGDGSENGEPGNGRDVVMVSSDQTGDDNKEKEADTVPIETQHRVITSRQEEECSASGASSVADESNSSEQIHSQRVSVGKFGVLCRVPDCVKYAKLKHLCVAHGGFRACKVHGCSRKVFSQNLCCKHGGGAGIKCKIDGCNKYIVSSGKGHCTRHAREYGVLPKLICKVPGCSGLRMGKFYCREHSRSGKDKQEPRKRAQPFDGNETSSATRSHVTCRAVACMKWVKRNGDDNEYCVHHRCPSASRDDSPRDSRLNQEEPDDIEPKEQDDGVKKGCGSGYTCRRPGCHKERALKGLCVAHGGFHVGKAAGCDKRTVVGRRTRAS